MSSSLASFAESYADFGPAGVNRFASTLDPAWVEEALAATERGKAVNHRPRTRRRPRTRVATWAGGAAPRPQLSKKH